MRKLCTFLMVLALVVLCAILMPAEIEAAEIIAGGTCGAEGDNLTWTLDDEGTLTISGTGAMWSYREWYWEMPDDGGAPPWSTFCTSIIRIIIEPGVTSIADYAFTYGRAITSVTIPDGVTSIGDWAFADCSSLTDISIPDSVNSIGNSAFGGCSSLTSITIPDGVTSIDGAFLGCSSLTSITIPDGVTSIESAFGGCHSLTNITIPDSVTNVGETAFIDCHGLTSVTIPNSVTSIGYSAFSGCASLTSVIYCGTEEQWNNIQIDMYNEALTEATRSYHNYVDGFCKFCGESEETCIHNVVNGICTICKKYGTCGAEGDNLVWTLDDEGTLTISGAGAMNDYHFAGICPPWYSSRSSVKTVVIEDGVTSIGGYAFYRCDSLTSITIPNSVTCIGGGAFRSCTSLTSVYITDLSAWCNISFNVASEMEEDIFGMYDQVDYHGNPLDSGAKLYLNGELVTAIVIPDSVTLISNFAFINYSSLTSVTIPDSVSNIGYGAFQNCTGLTNVTYCGTAEQWAQISIDYQNTKLINASLSYHEWSEGTAKSPTYTAMGKQVYVCKHCGEEKTESIPARFYGTSVNLGNTLDMYFGFYIGLVDEDGKVVIVREFADGTMETTEAPITSFRKNNSVYDISYTGLAAKEMCDTIHVYVYNSEGTLVGEHSDSIRSYILRQLREKDYGQEFRTLCIDLLNYGAAAQEAFGYNPDDLANKDLTKEELDEGTQTMDAYTDKQTIVGQASSYYGTAYILETQISMAMAVRADRIGADCYALVSYTDHTGEEKTNIRVEGKLNYSVYEFILNEIVVADGRCLLTIDFYKADGTKVLTVRDSMESYTARNAADYPLAEKMLAFSDSAYDYLHRMDSEIVELNVDLLQSKKYVAYELIDENELLMEYTIGQNPSIEDNVMIFSTGEYYYYAEPDFDITNAQSVQYGGKTYYGGDGGFGGYWLVVNGNTLEAYDEWNAWLHADSQSNATYAMQRNGDLRLIKGDANQYPSLWTSQMS